ncbi:MAG: cobyric acid synthase, partial [Pseudomonadota bacterium]
GAQVVVQGKRIATEKAREYAKRKPQLLAAVLESFERIKTQADLVLVEGAGSPAEVNLRAGDIANMGFAQAAGVPVVLVGDIDRGGVIAQLVGTQAVLDPSDAAFIRGFAINKFRGDTSLFDDGYALIAQRTGWRGLGVIPWFKDAHLLPAEDAQDLPRMSTEGGLKIAVPTLSRIANFDDLDPLSAEPNVSVQMVRAGQPLPGDADLVILPGSKSTSGDMAFFREQGWDIDLAAHLRRGGHVLGLCGGYQMLGRRIVDPDGIEGAPGQMRGLGLLDVETVMRPEKHLRDVDATHLPTGEAVRGYEMHIGETSGPDRARALMDIAGRPEGAISANGQVAGTYMHGIFAADGFRRAYLARLGTRSEISSYGAQVERTLDALADHLTTHMDLDGLMEIAQAGV